MPSINNIPASLYALAIELSNEDHTPPDVSDVFIILVSFKLTTIDLTLPNGLIIGI